MRPVLAFAGGYTAGHITPGLAVIEWLREQDAACDFLFMGAANGWERELVGRACVPFVGVPAVPWTGQPITTRCAALLRLVPAIFAARRRLRAARVTGVVGLGSFASVAPALAARSLGIPVTIYEPNATLGLANRLLRKGARALLVSRLFARGQVRGNGAIVEAGVPLRASVGALATTSPEPPTSGLRLLVLGGSRGNPFLNERMPEVARQLRAMGGALSITHQCGHDVAPAPLAAAYASAGIAAQVESYLDPIAPHFRVADFVVSAAGAITLHELAAAGVPALVVPLDSGGGAHQQNNARAFARITGCPYLAPASWDDARMVDEIAGTIRDRSRWRDQNAGLRLLANCAAAERFARAILD